MSKAGQLAASDNGVWIAAVSLETDMHIRIYVYAYIYTYIYIYNTYAHTYVCMYVCIYIYIYKHIVIISIIKYYSCYHY